MTDQLKKRIMRRIYVIFFLKRVFSEFALKTYAFVGLMWAGVSLVSVGNVFKNMLNVSGGLDDFYNFFTYAFLHTTMVVQMLFIGFIITMLSILLDLFGSNLKFGYLKV